MSQKYVGEEYISNQGEKFTIIENLGKGQCTVKFNDGTIVGGKFITRLRKGQIKNPMKPVVYGMGFTGIGRHKAISTKEGNNYYYNWKIILMRAYSEDYSYKHPTYKDVAVCEEWHNFQNFGDWFENNHVDGFQIDKDILVKGNKIYSPEMCCFVPQEINKLFIKSDNSRGELPIGVSLHKEGRFKAVVTTNKGQTYLGLFDTSEEAFQAYKVAKEQYIKEQADKWRGEITEETYNAMYNYQVEIID